MVDILIFNVELGQCIFIYPRNEPDYGLMVDCGNTQDFQPVDFLIDNNFLSYYSHKSKYKLPNLTLTNYDQDHFSGLPYLQNKVWIKSIRFPRNLSSSEIKNIKQVYTKAVQEVTQLLDTYIDDVTDWEPPYTKDCYYLKKTDFSNEDLDTNKLSQLVFVTFQSTTICIPGDLTSSAWDKHIENENVKDLLQRTNIFVASHHGHQDGYNESIFKYCNPEVIILSDKDIIHTTQHGQAQKYASKIAGSGIVFNGNTAKLRKTLTTRNDGHLWIRIEENGSKTYQNFNI